MKIEATILPTDITQSGKDARQLEKMGVDAVYSFEGPHDPFFPLLLAAQETERVELGTAIAIAFARNPMICANIANDLQLLTGGRFILGLGSQIKPHIERRFSQTWSRPAARMKEFVQAIRAIWRAWGEGERLDFRGEFYTHTLMTPFFNPGPNPHGNPRIFLAAVGPKMLEMTGQVADGVFIHPLHTADYLQAATLPAVETGLASANRSRTEFEVCCQTICMMGANDEQIETARGKARGQISFYGSTPAYRGVLDCHGWGDLQQELNVLSKRGAWLEMAGRIPDEVVEEVAIVGPRAAVADRIHERYGAFAARVSPVAPFMPDPDAMAAIVSDLRSRG